MLADQPNVTSSYLNELLEAFAKNPEKIIASQYGKSVGVPAIFPKKYFPRLMKLEGDSGAKIFLNQPHLDVIKTELINLIDIDTVDDYENVKE